MGAVLPWSWETAPLLAGQKRKAYENLQVLVDVSFYAFARFFWRVAILRQPGVGENPKNLCLQTFGGDFAHAWLTAGTRSE